MGLTVAVHLVVGLGRRVGVIMVVVILAHPIVSSQWS